MVAIDLFQKWKEIYVGEATIKIILLFEIVDVMFIVVCTNFILHVKNCLFIFFYPVWVHNDKPNILARLDIVYSLSFIPDEWSTSFYFLQIITIARFTIVTCFSAS